MTPEEREYANDNMAEADLLLREVRRLLREVRRDFDRVLARVDELEAENAKLREVAIPADDREGLLAALGAEQIGWEHTTDELCIGSFVNDDCPDCVPVYKVQP